MITLYDILRIARDFLGKIRLAINMDQLVSVPLRTALVCARLIQQEIARLRTRNKELEYRLNHGGTVNRMNDKQELAENREYLSMLENNCHKTLRPIVQEFHQQI